MMKSYNFDTKPFEAMFAGPARAYASLSIEYTEKLLGAQLEAAKAYTDTSLAQVRELFNVRDADSLRLYVESQQQVAQQVAERLKGDAQKVVSLHQDYLQQSQKVVESSLKQARSSASEQSATEQTAKS